MDNNIAVHLSNDIARLVVAISSLIQAMGMHAENQQREINGEAMAYREDSFSELANGMNY